MVPVLTRSYAFVQVLDDNKVPCRSLSDLQSLQKAPCAARAHSIILMRIGTIHEHMHTQTLKMHNIKLAPRIPVEGSTEG